MANNMLSIFLKYSSVSSKNLKKVFLKRPSIPHHWLEQFTMDTTNKTTMNPDDMSEDSIEKEEFADLKIDGTKLESANTSGQMRARNTEAGLTPGRRNLRKWLGKTFRVVISDGRVLVGFFNCTDKDANLVLSMCAEYLEEGKDARILGNVMVPGKHIVSISIDEPTDETLGT